MTATAKKTETTPEQRLTVCKHLAGGKDLDTTLTRLDRSEVLDIGSKHGFPDTAKLAWAVTILEKNLDEDLAPPPSPHQADIARAARRDSQPDAATTPAAPDALGALLNTAKGHPSKRIQHQADRVIDAVDKLRGLLREDQEKNAEKRKVAADRAAAKAEVERLEAQLRAARDKLRGAKPTSTGGKAQNGGSDSAKIRTWAAANDVACSPVGRVPTAVREAYDAAHPAGD